MRRILVVEDDAEAVRMLGFALRENGYEVATAATGYLALGEVAKRDPDVILLDLFLSGGMNGGEFLGQYRRSGGRAKVIVISGAARADPIARDLIVDEFVGKPFDLERLLESVRRFAYD
ncbi:MAG TPA: response regulator [Candidatus Limnocylindria bacterium]|jgi:CheY-like chemotaxis protein|nr:response regulator [Candidatus Limnocylindria bacterium]